MPETPTADIAERNKEMVRAFFRALENEDIPGFLGFFAEDGRQINPYASGLFPEGAEGLEALREYWEPVPGRFDGMRFPIDELHAMEDPNVVFVRYRGEIMLKDGAGRYANTYYSTFRFDGEGKITEYVEIFNPIVAARSFGLLDQLVTNTPEPNSMSDATAITNTLARYFAAVDGRDWEPLEVLMTSPFHLDYSSFGAGDPADLEPAVILEGWQQMLPGFEHTHHQIGNLDIEVEGQQADVRCKVTATHQIGDEVWTVVGSYEITLERNAEQRDTGWKLSGLRFLFAYQAGATDLPAEAQRRVSAAG